MKMKKGFRKVLLGLVFLATITGVYALAAPHDTATFTTYADQWKWLGGILFAALTTEHFAPNADKQVPVSQ